MPEAVVAPRKSAIAFRTQYSAVHSSRAIDSPVSAIMIDILPDPRSGDNGVGFRMAEIFQKRDKAAMPGLSSNGTGNLHKARPHASAMPVKGRARKVR